MALRKTIFKTDSDYLDGFRLRGKDSTRIEVFSDAVFAFSISLLVMSNHIPDTYKELIQFMEGFMSFILCMLLLVLVWYHHYMFFIKYGLKDSKTVRINTVLLFLIIFYLYPLKFLFNYLTQYFGNIFKGVVIDPIYFQHNLEIFTNMIKPVELNGLMIIYGFGFVGIFACFAWLYKHALSLKDELALNKLEIFDTKSSIKSNLMLASFGLISIIVAIIGFKYKMIWGGMLAGMVYIPIGLVSSFLDRHNKKQKAIILDKMKADGYEI